MYSIIVPCYNEEEYIGNLLKSIEQTGYDCDNFEVIISLNNCSDKTEEVVNNFKSHVDFQIKLVSETQVGVSYARNTGAKNASGEFYIFLDADIIVQKTFFSELEFIIKNKKALSGTFRTLPDRNDIGGYLFFWLLELVKMYWPKPFGKGFIRQDIFRRIGGFDPQIELGENVDFLVRAKRDVKELKGYFGHILTPVYCSLRRFDHEGYLAIALPWLVAYMGIKTLKYKTFSEINQTKSKAISLRFKLPFVNYINSYFLYPLAEKIQKRNIISKLKAINEIESFSQSNKAAYTKQKLYEVCKEASINVPYYRELFKEIGFSPDSILDDVSNIEKIPYLTKDIIQKQGRRLLNQKMLETEVLHERKTGGSTGASTLIYYSQEALDWTAASNLYAISLTGKKRHFSEVHLSSYFPETFPIRDRIKESIKCLTLNRTNITTHSFDDVDMACILDEIKRVKPFYLEGHPSTLYRLAEYIKNNDIQLDSPLFNVFESTGEVLDLHKRETIESFVGCKVFNRYGSAEFGVVAHQERSDFHDMKIMGSMVFPELYDKYKSDITHTLEVDEDGNLLAYPTARMGKVWKARSDLQQAFPYGLTAQCREYWNWWLTCSKAECGQEYVLPTQLLEPNISPKALRNILIELVWKNRSDLQEVISSPEQGNTLLDWWEENGIYEYYDGFNVFLGGSELVLTTLSNTAMPLIRYRTGDMVGTLERKDNDIFIDNVGGRIHDVVNIGNKSYPTHYVQDLLDRIGGISEFQLEQFSEGIVVLRLVVPDENLHRMITSRINMWWQDKVEVEFIKLEQLQRTGWRDKFRYVISNKSQASENV